MPDPTGVRHVPGFVWFFVAGGAVVVLWYAVLAVLPAANGPDWRPPRAALWSVRVVANGLFIVGLVALVRFARRRVSYAAAYEPVADLGESIMGGRCHVCDAPAVEALAAHPPDRFGSHVLLCATCSDLVRRRDAAGLSERIDDLLGSDGTWTIDLVEALNRRT